MPATIEEFNRGLDGTIAEVARKLEPLIGRGLPGSEAKVWHGHPVWFRGKDPLVGYKPYPRFVTLMFWQGQQFADPGDLKPASNQMAVIKYASPDEVDEAAVLEWARQAQSLAAE
ncbi:DUF1801 domain-containing protein [Micrococcaceae bacterium Sec5.7]